MPLPSLSYRRRHPAPPVFLGLTLFVLLPGGLCGPLPPVQAGSAPITSAATGAAVPAGSKEDLEKQKLAQEVLQLKNANVSHIAFWDLLANYLPFITALGTVAGLYFTVRKMGDDRRVASDQARASAQQERDQRDADSRRWLAEQKAERQQHLDQSFGVALTNLRGDDDQGKAGAVVSLLSFLKPEPEYAGFYSQVFLILQAMLKLMCPAPEQEPDHSEVKKLFVHAFEQTLGVLPVSSPLRTDMDLARMYLRRADLSSLNLRHADMGFCAMQGADLSGSDLFRVRGIGVQWEGARLTNARLGEARLKSASCRRANFHGAWLVSAVLKGADLRNADFRGASLQSAHLEAANLAGANFTGADLNDTYFLGANFDNATIQTIAQAHNWQKEADSHFSPDIIPRLKQAREVEDAKREKREQEQAGIAKPSEAAGGGKANV